ncbi:MAG: glycosyltransferase family 2 protein [Sedimentisphaerales bacterium]|nr:glycosyltransferase family 2 protein [Sedimentisphaerales bacterium]
MTGRPLSLTVIIPTLQRAASVRRLLDSIARQSRLPEQILVVDASEDRDTETVVQQADAVLRGRLTYFRSERGLTRQRNFAIHKARGDLVGFFDDDVVLDEEYLERMAEVFETDASGRIGGATGWVYPRQVPMGFWHRLYDRTRSVLSGAEYMHRYYQAPPMPRRPFRDPVAIRYVSGCNMFFRKEVFEQYLFDSWFEGYGYGEDMDFGLRVSRTWRIMAVGAARLHHLFEPAGRPNHRKLSRMVIENRLRLLVLARRDHLGYYAALMLLRELAGAALTGLGLLATRQAAAARDRLAGAWQGAKSGLQYVWNYGKTNG